jgi:hypothetical protein
MPTIDFTQEEIEVMQDVLQHRLNEIDIEVFRTDAIDFKQMLKHRREVLEHAMLKLKAYPLAA